MTIATPALLAFALAMIVQPFAIRWLIALKAQTYHWQKTDIDNSTFLSLHQKKIGTPSMGGIVLVVVTSVLAPIFVHSLLAPIFVVVICSFGALGLLDDASKLAVRSGRRTKELAARPKFMAQWALALLCGVLFYSVLGEHVAHVSRGIAWDVGAGYAALAALVLVSTTNAVNITDGLDGLAGGTVGIICLGLLFLTLHQGRTQEAMLIAILLATLIAFLSVNIHPARVFMGDVGALGLGAGLASLAMLSNNLLYLVIASGVLIVETLSSATQTIALRRGHKIFRIAPLHHHLEAVGWTETTITTTFWVVTLICVGAGLWISLR